jgi:plastocyanin
VRQVDAQGRAIWYVRAGTRSADAHVELNQFLPDITTISQGDTIVWYNDSPTTPHTITFPVANADPPEFLVPTLPDGTPLTGPPPAGPPPAGPPDPSMMPRLVLGPGSFPTHPGQLASYDGTGLYNSGLLGDAAPPQAGSTWGMVFNTPGTFKFLCVVHPGMEGTVLVQPR